MPSKKQVTFASIAELFHLPIVEVAGILGVCTTVLKKVCRRNGIQRWPQRKLQSLNKRIELLEDSLTTETEVERNQLSSELGCLKKRRLSLTSPLGSRDAPVRDQAKQQKAAELVRTCAVSQWHLPSSKPPAGAVVIAHGPAKRPRDACDHLEKVSTATTPTELGVGHHLAANVLPPYEAADGGGTARMVEGLAPINSEGAMRPRGLFQNHPASGRTTYSLHPLVQATPDASTTLCADKQQLVEIDDAHNPALALLELCGRGTSTDTEAAADPDSATHHGAAHSSVSASASGAQLAAGLTYMAAAPPTSCMHLSAEPRQVVQAHPMLQAHQAAVGRHSLVYTAVPASLAPSTSQAYWNSVSGSGMNENTNYWSSAAYMSHIQVADASSICPGHQRQYSLCTSTAPLASVCAAPTPVIQVPVQSSRRFRSGTTPVLGMGSVLKPKYEELMPPVAFRPSSLMPPHVVGQVKQEAVVPQLSSKSAVTLLTLQPVEGRIPSRYNSPSDICTVDLMAP